MNVKNFIVGGIVGGIVNYLLGWLVYGILLNDPTSPNAGKENLWVIFAGCMLFGFLISYIFSLGEGISNYLQGIKMAAGVGFITSIWFDCFYHMYDHGLDLKFTAMGAIISMILASIVGAVVAVVNSKMK